jgi:hypothetical protein
MLAEDEMAEIREVASANHLTVAEWVRQALRRAREGEPRKSRRQKLEALDAAARYSFPIADIDVVLDEIERGYLERT